MSKHWDTIVLLSGVALLIIALCDGNELATVGCTLNVLRHIQVLNYQGYFKNGAN